MEMRMQTITSCPKTATNPFPEYILQEYVLSASFFSFPLKEKE